MPSGRIRRFLCCAALLPSGSTLSFAQNTEPNAPPVIDVHHHAMNADHLTPEQKRDILYNNAARFLRLEPARGQ